MSARRRALLITTVAIVLAGLAWLGSRLAADTRISIDADSGTTRLTVSTELPAATCSKELTGEFPWVRFDCTPRASDGAGADGPPAPSGTSGLDTVLQGE